MRRGMNDNGLLEYLTRNNLSLMSKNYNNALHRCKHFSDLKMKTIVAIEDYNKLQIVTSVGSG